MAITKPILPNATASLFLTDGGLETTLVFMEGYELLCFAAFDLLKDEQGYTTIKKYYRRYLNIAKQYKTNFILESPTWRASPDWIEKIGYPLAALSEVNTKAVQFLLELKQEFQDEIQHIVLSGCIGPRGDGYVPGKIMTPEEARNYHAAQIKIFAQARVDIVSAFTMNYVEEAIGITHAAGDAGLPAVISFTVETNGKLATGMSLKEAIMQTDAVPQPPLYYMINCAHPEHFMQPLNEDKDADWVSRIRGLRANSSCKSHAELDEATELDRGNPHALGVEHRKLKEMFTQLNVFGGCCGTDEEHVRQIAGQVTAAASPF